MPAARAIPASLAGIRAFPGHVAHPMHCQERAWPETNCYVDLWIELLHLRGFVPEAMFGFTVRQDFESDQFTFFKPAMSDVEALYGLRLEELALYEGLEHHACAQTARGRPVLVEVDAWYLPDTAGKTYGRQHAKTTIGILDLAPETRELDYLHNAGRFTLCGRDYAGIFAPTLLPPYAEFVKRTKSPLPPSALPSAALDLLRVHRACAPRQNPVRAFRHALEERADALVRQPLSVFHAYAFHTTRQLGSNFEMLGAHLAWLQAQGSGDFEPPTRLAVRLANEAKVFQFQLARAFGRRNASGLSAQLDKAETTYEALFAALDRALE